MINRETIGIATVLYNSSRHLDTFVESLIANKEAIGEAIFVDNGSRDNPENILRKLDGIMPYSIIKNSANVGYAKAINQGIHKLFSKRYDFILVTNNDMKIKEGALSLLLQDMTGSSADVIGVPTTNDGKEYVLGCHYDKQKNEVVPDPKVTIQEIEERKARMPTVDTLYVQGGIILFNRSFFDKIGFYDEYLFFGGDESDFTLRILSCKEKVKAAISLRAYDKFDHFTHHDNRFKLLKAKMITQGETYVLMKHGYGLFSGKLYEKIKSLSAELGRRNTFRLILLCFLFIRALIVNILYLASTKKPLS